MDNEAVRRAEALPLEQRVHVIDGVLDVIAELGLADEVLRAIDRARSGQRALSRLAAAAVHGRLHDDPLALDEVVDAQRPRWWIRGMAPEADRPLACLVLVAPRLDAARWSRVPISVLSPVMPLVPSAVVLDAVPRAHASDELAGLLAHALATLDEDGRGLVRERVAGLGDSLEPEVHRVLASPQSRFAELLRREPTGWWIAEPTLRHIDELREVVRSLVQPQPGVPPHVDRAVQIAARLRDLLRGLFEDRSGPYPVPRSPTGPYLVPRSPTGPDDDAVGGERHRRGRQPDVDVANKSPTEKGMPTAGRGWPLGLPRTAPMDDEEPDITIGGLGRAGDEISLEHERSVRSIPILRRAEDGRPADRSTRGEIAEPSHEVSIGISPLAAADRSIVNECLTPDTPYWLWVEIARQPLPGAISGPHAPLPGMPSGTVLDVVLFTSDDQIRIDTAHRRGRVVLGANDATGVASAAEPPGTWGLRPHRLFFPVHTPHRLGTATVRVNVYCRGTLLQSHVVTAQVEAAARPGPGMLTRTIDYAITSQLQLARFAALPAPRLSILADTEPRTASHGFRFFAEGSAGEPAFVAEASLDGARLTPLIEFARRALRTAAWGQPCAWRSLGEHPYRYAEPTEAQLAADLIAMARHGARLWSEALIAFGIYDRDRERLCALLRTPGTVQLALQDGPRHVFPAALVYDHPLDSNRSDLAVCPAFLGDLAQGSQILGACLDGDCPHRDDPRIVCPGGFWGFRHDIGLTPHLRGREIATAIADRLTASWLLIANVSTDPVLTERAQHLEILARLPALRTIVIDERQRCLAALEMYAPHISYFYCHGGVTEAGTPYLEVGPRGSDMITSDNFTRHAAQDHAPRPLVVLNGCHTAAATPEQAFDLASGFLCHANAAGVVGTEITIFEPLARAFGEALLRHFVTGATLGAAVRRARLHLLAQRNPLGLAYVPYALPALALAHR